MPDVPADLTIRTATPADETWVNELLEASYPPLMRPSYEEAVLAAVLPLLTRANPALLSSGTYYLAEAEAGRIVGCGGWSRDGPRSGEATPELAHIRHFATHPEWIGRGIGRAIYARCEGDACSAGLRRFDCYSSLNAEGFYRALGFRSVRRTKLPMGQEVEPVAVLMERSIGPAARS